MPPRVLVCDDAPGFRLVMQMALEDAGLETLEPACSWAEAVDVAREQQPDAIVTDLWMPNFEPEALTDLCQAVPNCLLFVVSVLAVEEAREKIEPLVTVDNVFSKPAPPQAIAEQVRDALAARREV